VLGELCFRFVVSLFRRDVSERVWRLGSQLEWIDWPICVGSTEMDAVFGEFENVLSLLRMLVFTLTISFDVLLG
jgi:hypothetical protein